MHGKKVGDRICWSDVNWVKGQIDREGQAKAQNIGFNEGNKENMGCRQNQIGVLTCSAKGTGCTDNGDG